MAMLCLLVGNEFGHRAAKVLGPYLATLVLLEVLNVGGTLLVGQRLGPVLRRCDKFSFTLVVEQATASQTGIVF